MEKLKDNKALYKQGLFLTFIILSFCTSNQEEILNLDKMLPVGAMDEIILVYPEFKVTLVDERNANVTVSFNDQFMRIDGVNNQEDRERLANYILQYLENPNKVKEDIAKMEAYDNLPPKEKLKSFEDRISTRYPLFTYEWVGLDDGNVKKAYGDNSLVINGIENDDVREEIAYALIELQREIDKLNQGEQP